MKNARVFQSAAELEAAGRPFVLVTMIAHRGHAPQDEGAKACINEEGLQAGTIGGGRVEAKAIAYAQSLLSSADHPQIPVTVTWNLQKDVGMTCGGEVSYLFEVFVPALWEICVFGAGHVSQSLIPLLLTLNARVTCVDSRPEWLARLPAPSAKFQKILRSPLESVFDEELLGAETFFVCVTMGHATDLPVLEQIYRRGGAPYVGVIGSPVKAQKIRADLSKLGFEKGVAELRCPMGLVLGSNDPAEIAISIAAELLQTRESRRALGASPGTGSPI